MRSSARSISWQQRLSTAWQSHGLLACLLWPLSLLFGMLGSGRRRLYRRGLLQSFRLPVPVIVVGNIFVGGTGKTPLVIWLVQALRRAGFEPGVISRGYGATAQTICTVTADSTAAHVGDEPLLIAQRAGCAVVIGRDRVAAGRRLLRDHPAVNVIISDDGLQHYRLQRTFEIMLFDERGGGNRWLLPAGPLREPMSRRRDATIVNGGSIPASFPPQTMLMQLCGEYAEALSDRTLRRPLRGLTGRILAAAGIGNPQRFFTLLRDSGLTTETMALPDHHVFSAASFAGVEADLILITEKDAVKCAQIDSLKNDPRLWVVPVAARIDDALADQILEKLRGYPTA
jgi:tetraacyldisaccharide 4'-kinase